MRWLPSIFVGQLQACLPFTDAAAERLEEVLLATTSEERQELSVSLLSDDPALLLWALAQLPRAQRRETRDVEDARSRLGERWLDGILQISEHPAEWLERSEAKQAGKIAAASVAVAQLAHDIAPADEAEESYFVGLLQSAGNWLSLREHVAFSEEELADWLPRVGDGLEGRSANPPSASYVIQAVALLGGESSDESKTAEEQHQSQIARATARRLEIQQAWNHEDRAAQNRLQRLAPRLARFERLDQQFAENLELEKLASLRQLAYGAGHEINNPLANISARAQTLLKLEEDPERRRSLAAINSQAFRAHEMIADLMLFSHPPALTCEEIDLTELTDVLLQELAQDASAQQTRLVRHDSREKVPVHADPLQMSVAIRAVMKNSLEALGRGGTLALDVRSSDDGSEAGEIIVSDDGPGIPPETRKHLFDPFFSGREAGRGLGFGLSKCWQIVHQHEGRVEVDSPATGGTVIRIVIPRQDTLSEQKATDDYDS